jgi:signal transduction histidine kinase
MNEHNNQRSPIHVLLVEDELGDAELAHVALRSYLNDRFAVEWVRSLAEACNRLDKQSYAVVLLDLGLPDSFGLETLTRLCAVPGVPPIIVLTVLNDANLGLSTLKAGAADYLVKGDFGYNGLARTIIYTLHRTGLERELLTYHHHLEQLVAERTAELLTVKDAAEAANRAKSMFLANVSHELRTPLNAILGFSTILRRDSQLNDQQRQQLDIINRSGEHLLTLINDVLEVAKIEAGRIVLEQAPLDLGSLVRDVSEMMSVRAQEKGLRLLVEQSSQFPRFILGDEPRLRQILINLVGNAIKFTRQGGVTVRFGIRNNAADHLLIKVEVEDTGIGIAPQDQARLFEPFVQVGEHGVNKGTGLGLTITRQFVQLMGGTITLESAPGKGSLFRVEWPVTEAAAAAITRTVSAEQGQVTGLLPGQPEYRILIVEDQQENQLLLAHLMENIGLRYQIAADGKQGLDMFQRWQPHLIFMDQRMPVMDGMEATRAIRQLPGGREVKIVAVTASVLKEQRDEMLKVGMDAFVSKPYRFEEIYDCLSQQLGLKYVRESAAEAAPEEPIQLTPQMLAVLSDPLRAELKAALEILDSEEVATALQKLKPLDAALYQSLSKLADDFDYPAILHWLAQCRSGGGDGIAPVTPPTPPDMRSSASGGWTRQPSSGREV